MTSADVSQLIIQWPEVQLCLVLTRQCQYLFMSIWLELFTNLTSALLINWTPNKRWRLGNDSCSDTDLSFLWKDPHVFCTKSVGRPPPTLSRSELFSSVNYSTYTVPKKCRFTWFESNVVLQFGRLVARVSTQRLWFNPRSVYVVSVVIHRHLGRFFSGLSRFPLSATFSVIHESEGRQRPHKPQCRQHTAWSHPSIMQQIRGTAQWLYHGVLYCQNVTRLHSTDARCHSTRSYTDRPLWNSKLSLL